jgi:hypothetical protein
MPTFPVCAMCANYNLWFSNDVDKIFFVPWKWCDQQYTVSVNKHIYLLLFGLFICIPACSQSLDFFILKSCHSDLSQRHCQWNWSFWKKMYLICCQFLTLSVTEMRPARLCCLCLYTSLYLNDCVAPTAEFGTCSRSRAGSKYWFWCFIISNKVKLNAF